MAKILGIISSTLDRVESRAQTPLDFSEGDWARD